MKLGAMLAGAVAGRVVVVGVAPGGAVVGAEVAIRLGVPLDLVAVARIEHPAESGRTIGAVSSDGEVYLHTDGELMQREITESITRVEREAELLGRQLRAEGEPVDLEGARVVLVDDGVDTGATMRVATRMVRARGASHVVVAVPVGSVGGLTRVLREVTETACLHVLHDLGAISTWYESFPVVDQSTMTRCIRRAGTLRPSPPATK
jgi:putative phosphoribosyl transferase